MNFNREACTAAGCRQAACLASGDERLCGDHWRDYQLTERGKYSRAAILADIDAAKTIADVRDILRRIVEGS